MGEVWRARDTKLKREVAIKILPDEFSRDTGRVARFEREAQPLAALNPSLGTRWCGCQPCDRDGGGVVGGGAE